MRSAFDIQSSPYRSYADALVGPLANFISSTVMILEHNYVIMNWSTREQIQTKVFWTIVQKLGLKGCEFGDETHMNQRKIITNIVRKDFQKWGLCGAYDNKFYQSHLDVLYDIFEEYYILISFSFPAAKYK